MIRLPAAAFTVVLFVVPLLTSPRPPVLVTGLVGLFLASVAIVGLWRGPATAAACVFLIDYAGALWMAGGSVSVGAAATFGLSLLLLLESVQLGRSLRHASVDVRVVRSQIAGWMGFGVATVAAAMLGLALAGALVVSIPLAAAPFVAAAAALGVVLTLAATVVGTFGRDVTRR